MCIKIFKLTIIAFLFFVPKLLVGQCENLTKYGAFNYRNNVRGMYDITVNDNVIIYRQNAEYLWTDRITKIEQQCFGMTVYTNTEKWQFFYSFKEDCEYDCQIFEKAYLHIGNNVFYFK